MTLQDKWLRQAALFYAIALTLAVILAAAAPLIGPGVLLLTMLTPAVSVLICRIVLPEGQKFRFAELGLARLGLRYWPFALVVPIVALLPGYLLVWGTGIARIAELPADANPVQLVVSFAAAIVFGATLGALGEEVGWRGYLLPRLAASIGVFRAGLLTGFLHGFWHVPLILLTPYFLSAAPDVAVVPLFLALVTLSGPIFAHLRFASGSIVPVALMHHAWNGYWDTLAGITTGENTVLILYLSGESGIASIVMMAALVFWLRRRGARTRALPVAT